MSDFNINALVVDYKNYQKYISLSYKIWVYLNVFNHINHGILNKRIYNL